MARKKNITSKSSPRRKNQSRETVEAEAVESEAVESAVTRTAAPELNSKQSSEAKSEDAKMEEGKGVFEGLSETARALFSLDAARGTVALYIDAGEALAEGALNFQAKANEWAKDTPLGALLEAQNSMGRKLVELSADAARRMWRIEKTREA